MNLKEEAKRIAEEALEESADSPRYAGELVEIACRDHKVAHCEATAVRACIEQASGDLIDYLVEYEGLVIGPRDTLGDMVCRVAWHTLSLAALEYLAEIKQKEPNE